MNKFDSSDSSPRFEADLFPVVHPTVEEHAERCGLNGRRKAFQRALVFANAGYAQGQRVSAQAFRAALDAALSTPLRSSRLSSSYLPSLA